MVTYDQLTIHVLVDKCFRAAQMRCAFSHKITVRALIFLFLFFSTPTIGDASNYFYTNELGLSSRVLSTVISVIAYICDLLPQVAVFGNIAGVVGIAIYQKLLRGVSIWSMIFWGSIICCILGCIGVTTHFRLSLNRVGWMT